MRALEKVARVNGTPTLRQAFVPLGSKPFVVPYNASLPIVLYTPKDLEVRWRLWKAEAVQRPAQPLQPLRRLLGGLVFF